MAKLYFSTWFISHPLCFPEMSCINADGTISEERLQYFCDIAKINGATGMRVLPFLQVDKKMKPDMGDGLYLYQPWYYDIESGLFDLDKVNGLFYRNLSTAARLINGNGLELMYSMYDMCHMGTSRIKSPFLHNRNGVTLFGRSKYHNYYEDKVISTFKDGNNVVSFCLFNEPRGDVSKILNITKPLCDKLLNNGYRHNQVVSGMEWMRNYPAGFFCSGDYVLWRKKMNFFDENSGGISGITGGYAEVHGSLSGVLKNSDMMDAQRHRRKFFLSSDGGGKNISYNEIVRMFSDFLSHRGVMNNDWCYEYVYYGYGTILVGAAAIHDALANDSVAVMNGSMDGYTSIGNIYNLPEDPGNENLDDTNPKPEIDIDYKSFFTEIVNIVDRYRMKL
jgi:hypothetical protein